MSLTTTVQDWMRDISPREASVVIARTHVAAETSTDVDQICATISHDVYFGVPRRTRAGNEIPPGSVLTTYDQVRGYYSGRSGSYVVVASMQLKTVSTAWYVFNESAATCRGTGMIGGVDATGREFVVDSAVIFPTALDGIRGEICATRYPFDDIVAGTVQATAAPADPRSYLPLREMEHAGLHERVLAALRESDTPALGAALSTGHTLAVRLDDAAGRQTVRTATTQAEAVAALGALFEGAADITVLTRISSDWYVFAEYLVALERGGVRRLAVTHTAEHGVFSSTFGYGRDEQ